MPTQLCYECGRPTPNLDGECGWCKEREERENFDDDFDDDVSAMERRYENYIGRT